MTATTRGSSPHASSARRTPSALASVAAIVRRGLLDNRRAPLTWGGALGAFGVLIAVTWPSIEDSVGEIVELYPEGLREAFNVDAITTFEGYVDAEMLTFIVPLAVAFLAIRTVARATAGAEEKRWLDTLLATPVSRRQLVAGSFTVTAAVAATVLAVTVAMTTIAAALVGAEPDAWALIRGMANVWPLVMFFAGLAMLAAGLSHSATRVTAVAAGALVGMYAIDLVGKLADSLDWIRWASAFRYYGSAVQDGIDPVVFLGLTLAALSLAWAGALLFERRDVFG
ncbi:MAG: ABC transporter permease subunit [Solirubrobacterales bacterium]